MKTLTSFIMRLQRIVLFAASCHFGTSTSLAQDATTVVKPNDIISVEVFNEPRVSVPQATVSKSGEASVPLLGQVNLDKLTLNEASEKIRRLLQEDLLVDPKVTVKILKQADESISILGSVKLSGQIVIPANGMDLSTAVATAGGLLETADPNRIELSRSNGQKAIYTIGDINNGAAGKIKLINGDRILVGQSPYVGKFVTISGQVAKRGLIAFPLDGKLDLISAIALSGGLTELANGKIFLTRDGKTETINYKNFSEKGEKSPMLRPSDNIEADMRGF